MRAADRAPFYFLRLRAASPARASRLSVAVVGSGTNPGRLGGSMSVGATYELTEHWNLHGNYNFDVADDNTEHNVNFGASYKF